MKIRASDPELVIAGREKHVAKFAAQQPKSFANDFETVRNIAGDDQGIVAISNVGKFLQPAEIFYVVGMEIRRCKNTHAVDYTICV